MSRVTIDDGILTDVADAIRTQYQDDSPISPLDFAEAILGIEGGGGGGMPQGFEYGEVELMDDITDAITIEHNCGQIPNMFLIWTDGFLDRTTDNPIIKTSTSVACWVTSRSDGTNVTYGSKTWIINNSGISASTNYGGVSSINDEMISVSTRASTYPWRKELTYKWLAIYW